MDKPKSETKMKGKWKGFPLRGCENHSNPNNLITVIVSNPCLDYLNHTKQWIPYEHRDKIHWVGVTLAAASR